MRGEGEGTDVVDDFVQGVDQQQEEIGYLRDRAGDVADRNDFRPVAVLALPRREEGHAAPSCVAAERAADVEMAATLALARLRIALAQAACDLPDEGAHLGNLAPLDAGKRCIAQDLVTEIFGLLAGIKGKSL